MRNTKTGHSILSASAMSIAVMVMAAAPRAYAHEPAKNHMKGMSMTGDADFDFATNMRKHHQMALPMAQAELKNGKDPKMLQSAKDIIDGQTKEIAAFDQWLAAHKPSDSMKMRDK